MLATTCAATLLMVGCYSYVPNARIIQVPPDLSVEAQIRREDWDRICKPQIVLDRQGIGRYTYSSACPNGVIVGK